MEVNNLWGAGGGGGGSRYIDIYIYRIDLSKKWNQDYSSIPQELDDALPYKSYIPRVIEIKNLSSKCQSVV